MSRLPIKWLQKEGVDSFKRLHDLHQAMHMNAERDDCASEAVCLKKVMDLHMVSILIQGHVTMSSLGPFEYCSVCR